MVTPMWVTNKVLERRINETPSNQQEMAKKQLKRMDSDSQEALGGTGD